jgi:hypothetical protein
VFYYRHNRINHRADFKIATFKPFDFHMKKLIFSVCCLACFVASAQRVQVSKNIQQALNRIDTATIRSHIAYLADDKLKGRLPGTEGYTMAVDYVTGQFRKMGIAPAGDEGGFTQKLIVRKATLNNRSSVAVLKDAAGNVDSLFFCLPVCTCSAPD